MRDHVVVVSVTVYIAVKKISMMLFKQHKTTA